MNRHILIGWLGGGSEMFVSSNFKHGKQIAAELKKSEAWREVYEGSLIDLINLIKREAEG